MAIVHVVVGRSSSSQSCTASLMMAMSRLMRSLSLIDVVMQRLVVQVNSTV